ncbi:MAG: GtrA family protein [Candidatus Moranbacteria bacterium]|nr:GtrA family protein [Candidatus Moranbacteria bacterium]
MTKTKIQFSSRDIIFGAINGLIFGALLPVVLKNMNVAMSFNKGVIVAVFFTVLAAVGIYVGYLLSGIIPFLFQFAKFGAIGVANFAVDIGILNLLIFITGIAAGTYYTVFKVISFTFAVTNSYLWNKFWAFHKETTKEAGKEFVQFIAVSIIGLILNALVASILVNVVGPLGGIAPKTWASVSAAAASVCVMFWNFVGYKFWVFKK